QEHDKYRLIVKISEKLTSSKKITPSDSKSIHALLDGKIPDAVFQDLELPENRRLVVLGLIDHYGTGRIYFRNSRSVVQLENAAFPKRTLAKVILPKAVKGAPQSELTQWLATFGKEHRKEKILLICDSAKKVTEWEKILRDEYALKAVAFHEGLSPIARDRNAAFFEDPKGANFLLCSEIGGEGRNFQQASHLILPDLPEDPDALEQRIGRLDRIGQKSDITIHVPFVKGSREERLLRWHDEVFESFTSPAKGAGTIYENYRSQLDAPKTAFETVLKSAREDYLAQLELIEAGRDRLIELNSFDAVESLRLREEISAAENAGELQVYLDTLFDALGLTVDSLDSDSMFVEPGQSQYASYVPGLPSDGISFTFSRSKALARNDLTFMTWDHPMLLGTLESIARQEFGNVAVAAWANPLLIVECAFVLEPSAVDAQWFGDEFFPPTPVRVVLEATGKDLTSEWDWDKLRTSLTPVSERMVPMIRNLPSERIRGLLNKGAKTASDACALMKRDALRKMDEKIEFELDRLRALRGKNKIVSELELAWWTERRVRLNAAFTDAQVRLDSFLLVVPSRVGD
ncbi:MAG: hypothetical protein H7301_13305, partial [Cryobacterium sp.]|nr:hypothetical protein [Oligoflexia bacterium]